MLRVRAAVGPAVILRTDANRRWTLEQALQFGHAVKGAALQVTLLCSGSCSERCREACCQGSLMGVHPQC